MTVCVRPRRPTQLALVFALAAWGAGCGGEPPRIDGVQPLTMIAGEVTAINVTGGGFFWGYDAFGHQLIGEMQVRLDDIQVDRVTWLDAGHLSGLVPADLPTGIYDVTVETEAGAATRADAFVVRPQELAD